MRSHSLRFTTGGPEGLLNLQILANYLDHYQNNGNWYSGSSRLDYISLYTTMNHRQNHV